MPISRSQKPPPRYVRKPSRRWNISRRSAFLRQTPDIALQQARQAEAEILAGHWRGPLHGVPYGLKDIIDVAGVPTTAHSKILAERVLLKY